MGGTEIFLCMMYFKKEGKRHGVQPWWADYDVLELERSCNWGLGLSGKVSISRV